MPRTVAQDKIRHRSPDTADFGGRLDSQFHSKEVASLFAPGRQLAYMLEFEGALARVQGDLGLIPAAAAAVITDVCADRALIARIDLSSAPLAGNHAIPFVEQLTAHVHAVNADAAAWVHHGSTSQDVIDTSMMLAVRDAFILISRDLRQLSDTLAALAAKYARTPVIARTLLQQALPTTFGYKLAAALAGLDRVAENLAQLSHTHLFVQLGGPVGTLASAKALASQLVVGVATRLGLRASPICWHTNRVPIAECAAVLATLAGQLGKLCRDVVLLMQSEVGEASESPAPGKGGSTSMPHKRNPVDSLAVAAAANLAPQLAAALFSSMVQEHERAAGEWHAEWISLPQLCSLVHGSLVAAGKVFGGLRVDAQRMKANLAEAQRAIAANESNPASIERDVAAAEARTLEYLKQRGNGAG